MKWNKVVAEKFRVRQRGWSGELLNGAGEFQRGEVRFGMASARVTWRIRVW